MSVIERCDHCERVFDETEDPFIGPTGGDLCAHCAATWLGEERARLADQLTGAVSLSDEQWERVLWWLHKPLPPGPAKALDESIIRAINAQRGAVGA